MRTDTGTARIQDRVTLAVLGAASGLAFWVLAENWGGTVIPPRLFLALFAFVSVFSAVALALSGPVSITRAMAGGAGLALVVSLLVTLAGFRYATATDLLDDPVIPGVVSVLVIFATPFLSVWLNNRAGWLKYEALFVAAWTIFARYMAAWVFVAVVWLVILLSDTLLNLVDIDIIDRMMRIEWVRFVLTGAVLGLGLAVLYELRETLSPFLILRLLRLLVPVVLVVVAVFLAAIPFRGLSQLFRELSAATTLMGAAIVAITLISTALDRTDKSAVTTRGMVVSTHILSLLLPLLTALAVWAIVLRVRQYGWTPDRVLAATVAGFLLAYGLSYFAAAMRRSGWMARIRKANVVLALVVIAVSGLWLTPVLNAARISAKSQLARFMSGQSTVEQVPLWQMAHDWGRAGHAALERLEQAQDHPGIADLTMRITQARQQESRYHYERAVREARAPILANELKDLLAIRPDGAAFPAELLSKAEGFWTEQWLEGCRRKLPDGHPGCVLVLGGFAPRQTADLQGILLFLESDEMARATHVLMLPEGEVLVREVYDALARTRPEIPAAALQDVLSGGFEIRPTGSRALIVGDAVMSPEF